MKRTIFSVFMSVFLLGSLNSANNHVDSFEDISSDCFENAMELYNLYLAHGRSREVALQAGSDYYEDCLEWEAEALIPEPCGC
ncbi:hypothetical protein FJ651_05190 [Paucihalobacter ruber]|uniref:Uncharacterized protein n=1 Tax=Paucihalobacter ruber TaxID=2567861 RepID=A0A506PNX1_9FLAO|nr:hypothetical protein [Paucihalobacter ruber]TPV34925.1 hypothetical protein FJ651_05190 [Paucihalobacter ruber]